MAELIIGPDTVRIDDDDLEKVSSRTWYVREIRGVKYAFTNGRRGSDDPHTLGMHTLISGFAVTDHKDHDGLNNRRENLRDGSGPRNAQNTRSHRGSTSRFKGVSWDRSRNKWAAYIKAGSRHLNLGRFSDELEAARAYDEAARTHFGEYAHLNFPGAAQ